jgi:hypothetical protein
MTISWNSVIVMPCPERKRSSGRLVYLLKMRAALQRQASGRGDGANAASPGILRGALILLGGDASFVPLLGCGGRRVSRLRGDGELEAIAATGTTCARRRRVTHRRLVE